MADLGNKFNPVLAGLTGLGEGFLQGFMAKKKLNEKQRQFNEKMAMEERQNSFSQSLQQKQLEIQGFNADIAKQRADLATEKSKEPTYHFSEKGFYTSKPGETPTFTENTSTQKGDSFGKDRYEFIAETVVDGKRVKKLRDKFSTDPSKEFVYEPVVDSAPTEPTEATRIDARGNVFVKEGKKTKLYLNNDVGDKKLRSDLLGPKLEKYVSEIEKKYGRALTIDELNQEIKKHNKEFGLELSDTDLNNLQEYSGFILSRQEAKTNSNDAQLIINKLLGK